MIFVDYCRFYKISPTKNVTQSTNHVVVRKVDALLSIKVIMFSAFLPDFPSYFPEKATTGRGNTAGCPAGVIQNLNTPASG
jgi:hypothetical protein